MDNKLLTLLKKIHLKEEFYDTFKEARIIKIISSNDKKKWNFIIETNEALDIEILTYLDNNLKKYHYT